MRRFIIHISIGFIILLALLTVIFETYRDENFDKQEPMFPYMAKIKFSWKMKNGLNLSPFSGQTGLKKVSGLFFLSPEATFPLGKLFG